MNAKMILSRRSLLASTALTLGGGVIAWGVSQPAFAAPESYGVNALPPGEPHKEYTPVITPNGSTLPFTIVDGVKVFHLIAEEVEHEFSPGLKATCWGYNKQVHGPTIEAVEGDRVRIYVTNKLKASTTVHWHGLKVPFGMDGVGGLTQRAIKPGETFLYEFTLKQHGTLMYHSHHDEMTQMGMGLMGMFIIHPRETKSPRPDRDFALLSSEWKITPGTHRPDPFEMTEFNVLTFNARVFPGTEPLVVKTGERVRIRFGNLGAMDHHPLHLHGYTFKITATEGGDIPESAQWPDSTVLVPVGTTRTIEFLAEYPGDWALHCHMTHHVMTQMGHGNPNLIGIKAGDLDKKVQRLLPEYMTMGENGMGDMGGMNMGVPKNSLPMINTKGPYDDITMGGMFTILKVRDDIKSYEEPGWYTAPSQSIANVASESAMRRDGIKIII